MRRGRVLVFIACLVVLAGVVGAGGLAAQVLGAVVLGWWNYLARVLPRVRPTRDGVATGLVCLVLFAIGLHRLLGWISREIRRATDPSVSSPAPSRWRWQWTAAIVAMILLMFFVGIAATGVAHQTGWLLSSRTPLTEQVVRPRNPIERSEMRLKMIGLGLLEATSATEDATIPSGTTDDRGRPLMSWQLEILPFLSVRVSGTLDRARPWDDPRNSAVFQGVVPDFLNPEVVRFRDDRGYALSHYAGNSGVMRPGRAIAGRDLDAGASNVLVAGEAAGAFKPWGDPTNLRDAGTGINRSAEGFGGPSGIGANLLFLDGSVRTFRASTDARVLHALGNPRIRRSRPRQPSAPSE